MSADDYAVAHVASCPSTSTLDPLLPTDPEIRTAAYKLGKHYLDRYKLIFLFSSMITVVAIAVAAAYPTVISKASLQSGNHGVAFFGFFALFSLAVVVMSAFLYRVQWRQVQELRTGDQ